MAKVLSDVIYSTRVYLDEAAPQNFTAAEVLQAINSQYQALVTTAQTVWENYYITSTTTNTVANQQEYALPSTFFKTKRIEINYQPQVTNSTLQRALAIDTEGDPLNLGNTQLFNTALQGPTYYIQNNNLGFVPIPTEAGPDTAGNPTIKMWYIPYVVDMVDDTDNVNIPYADRYYQLIALGAAGLLLRKGQQQEAFATKYLANFESQLDKMKMELLDRQADGPVTFSITSYDDVDLGNYVF